MEFTKTKNQKNLLCIKLKKAPMYGAFNFYACPDGPKLSDIGGCSESLISP